MSMQERLERLEAENERLKLALAASGVVGLWDWRVDTDLLHGDANFARLYGLDPVKTAAGLTMEEYQEFVVPDDLLPLRADIRETFERGADFLVEYRLAVPGQPLRWVECKGRLIEDATGRPVRFSGTAIDITQRKQADEATRASEKLARESAEHAQHALANRDRSWNSAWQSVPVNATACGKPRRTCCWSLTSQAISAG